MCLTDGRPNYLPGLAPGQREGGVIENFIEVRQVRVIG